MGIATRSISILGLAILLTGCTAPVSNDTPEPTRDPVDVALELCIDAHPEVDEYADPDGEGYVQQTAAESCARWLTNVGEEQFVEQWDEDYAEMYRKAFGQ
jgi:hypothetical protein